MDSKRLYRFDIQLCPQGLGTKIMSADAATLDYRYLPQVIAPLGKRTRPRPQVKLTGSSNTTTSQLGGFESHFEKLKALAINQALWVDEQHPPSQDALAWARYILQN